MGRWSRKFPEWRPGTTDLVFDEGEDRNERRRRKKPERKQPKHSCLEFGGDRSHRGAFIL